MTTDGAMADPARDHGQLTPTSRVMILAVIHDWHTHVLARLQVHGQYASLPAPVCPPCDIYLDGPGLDGDLDALRNRDLELVPQLLHGGERYDGACVVQTCEWNRGQ